MEVPRRKPLISLAADASLAAASVTNSYVPQPPSRQVIRVTCVVRREITVGLCVVANSDQDYIMRAIITCPVDWRHDTKYISFAKVNGTKGVFGAREWRLEDNELEPSKTSLIRQLVGEELKFAPEVEIERRVEDDRRQLDSDWLTELCKHEQLLSQSIETKRLASLLASQIELQQLLLQQQRKKSRRLSQQLAPRDTMRDPMVTGELLAGKSKQHEKKSRRQQENETKPLGGPTILISSHRNVNCKPPSDALGESDDKVKNELQSRSDFLFSSGSNCTKQLEIPDKQKDLSRAVIKQSVNVKVGPKQEQPQRPDAHLNGTQVEGLGGAQFAANSKLPQESVRENCRLQNSTSSNLNSIQNANHVPSKIDEHLAAKGVAKLANQANASVCGLHVDATSNSNINSNLNLNPNLEPPDQSAGRVSSQQQQQQLKQDSLEIGLKIPSAASRTQLEPTNPRNQQHRHSYCAPDNHNPAELPSDKTQANGSTFRLNIKQQSELSTQAKIINILFTRNSSENNSKQTTNGPESDESPTGVASGAKVGKPMLMPSLLRQYQRRLSNFHQNAATGDESQQTNGKRAKNRQTPTIPSNSVAMTMADELNRRQLAAEASRAAASLATVAASAAQALIAHNRCSSTKKPTVNEITPREPKQTIVGFNWWQPEDKEDPNNLFKLYSLTDEFRERLADESKLLPSPFLENSIQLQNETRAKIRYFSANFVNNMNLYEIDIVDMPTIDPSAFPTSTLVEWNLFKGRSHLLTADAYLLVFDLSRPSSIQYIKMLRDKIFESREMSQVPVYVIANKADLCPTLQPSLQARQMRDVASRNKRQANGNNCQQSLANKTAQLSGDSGQVHSQPSGFRSFTFGNSRRPQTNDHLLVGSPEMRSMPTAAAHQLLAAYKVHRMRLGSKGPILSLRRWAQVRKAIVNTTSNPHDHLAGQGFQAAHWLQFERQSRHLHYNLIAGASNGDSIGNQWTSGFGRAYKRIKLYVQSGIKRLGGRRSDTNRADSQQQQTNGRVPNKKVSNRRRQVRRRRKQNALRVPKGIQASQSLSLGNSSRQLPASASSAPKSNNRSLIRWMTLGGETQSETNNRVIESRGGTKRKRFEHNDSSGSKSSSTHNDYRLSSPKDKNEFNCRSSKRRKDKQVESHLMSKTGELTFGVAPDPNMPIEESPKTQLESQTDQIKKVEPLCGSMSTPTSRQYFYELFNQLLYSSSTAAAKTQLKLSGLSSNTSENSSKVCDSKEPMKSAKTRGVFLTVGSNNNNNSDDNKSGKRRKSSSTGAALWQTLSSIALSSRHRDSTSSSALAQTTKSKLDQSSQGVQSSQEQGEQSARMGSNQKLLSEGLHLGTDQYLSVDMLRKLSLISAHSQMSNCAELSAETEELQVLQSAGNSPTRKASRGLLGAVRFHSSGAQHSNRDDSCRPNTTSPGSRAKKIWYRGVVKKILFQSNKHSLSNIVTAMELQRKANELAADSKAQQESNLPATLDSPLSLPIEAARRVSSVEARQVEVEETEPSNGSARRTSLAIPIATNRNKLDVSVTNVEAPSIRIIASGSSLSLVSQEHSGTNVKGDLLKRTANCGNSHSVAREQNIEFSLAPDSSQMSAANPNRERTSHINDETLGQPLGQVSVELDVSHCMQSSGDESPTSASSAGANEHLSIGSARSLTSLADSVSLSLEAPATNAAAPVDVKIRSKSATIMQNDHRCTSGNQNHSSTSNSNEELEVDDEDEEDNEPLYGEEIDSRLLATLAQPLANCTLRKLSADDCLIINRQRRQSLATESLVKSKCEFPTKTCRLGGVDLRDEHWRSAGDGRLDKVQSACGNPADDQKGANSEKELTADERAESVVGYSAEARRQSIKQSLEAAIHLLVPRAKGTRSASITLGASDCEQRSRSQLGTAIMGAVNLHKTWRDWRQLLGRKKSHPLTGLNASCQASGAARNIQANFLANLDPGRGGGLLQEESLLPLAGFLGTSLAFSKLSSEQQREAAINVDQLMQVNQLTLKAANAVILSTDPATGGLDFANTKCVDTEKGAKTSAKKSTKNHENLDESNDGQEKQKLESISNAIIGVHSSDKEKRRRESERKSQRPLMTRLQSGGQLLLRRSNTKPKEKVKKSKAKESTLELEANFSPVIEADTKFVSAAIATAAERSALSCKDIFTANGGQKRGKTSLESETFGELAARGSNITCLTDAGISSQIATAAAGALEKQKKRAERLSLILEPKYDKKQPGAQYPLFASHDLNPILKDLAQLVRKNWKCNYIECSAASNWNIRPIIGEITRALECNQRVLRHNRPLANGSSLTCKRINSVDSETIWSHSEQDLSCLEDYDDSLESASDEDASDYSLKSDSDTHSDHDHIYEDPKRDDNRNVLRPSDRQVSGVRSLAAKIFDSGSANVGQTSRVGSNCSGTTNVSYSKHKLGRSGDPIEIQVDLVQESPSGSQHQPSCEAAKTVTASDSRRRQKSIGSKGKNSCSIM